jgi:hypothetical protein
VLGLPAAGGRRDRAVVGGMWISQRAGEEGAGRRSARSRRRGRTELAVEMATEKAGPETVKICITKYFQDNIVILL